MKSHVYIVAGLHDIAVSRKFLQNTKLNADNFRAIRNAKGECNTKAR